MKKIILAVASLLLLSSLPTTSFAHSAHQAHSFRFSHQPHYFHHYRQRGSIDFYYPLYGSVPYVVQQPAAPTVYIQRHSVPGDSGTTTSQQDGYWFFCAASNTYYPYVRECSEPWQKVPQTPPQ